MYTALIQNLTDQIMEEQAKLGFDEKEIRLYYPLSSLCHIVGKTMTLPDMNAYLQGLSDAAENTLGKITFTHTEDRFCFHILPEGVKWVHDHTPEDAFIYALVRTVLRPDCTMEDVEDIFWQYGTAKVQSTASYEYEYLVYFIDGPDSYYYCFSDDGFDISYHRFLPEDYADLGYYVPGDYYA